jgi:phosphatidate cytidylyltransferase
MPRIPFADPLFWPVTLRIAAVLLAGLLGVVAAERRHWRELTRRTLFLRVRSWAIIAPVFLVSVFTGGVVVFALAAFVAYQGLVEYARLAGLEGRYLGVLIAWTLVGLLIASLARRYFLFLPLGLFLVVTLVPILSGRVRGAHQQVTSTLFGYLYIGLPMAYLVFIKSQEGWGLRFLCIVGLAVALSDVFAFVIGSALGGPRLAPAVSPGKTWAGAGGNLLGAAAGVTILSVARPPEWSAAGVVVLVLCVGLGSLWGDLTESFVKRDFAVKDAGTLLPGFGGMLDRVDSFLLALPLGYYGLIVANRAAG